LKTFDQKFPDKDEVVLATCGDWHIGADTCDQDAVEDFVGKIADSDAVVILMGDLTENAIVGSVGAVFEQSLSPRAQVKEVVRILSPIKDRIIGAVGGNHGARTQKVAGINPDEIICWELGVPYLGSTAVGRIKVGPDTDWRIMAHHGAGGGALLGSKLNVIAEKMTKIVPIADLYLAGHTHADVAGSDNRPTIGLGSGRVQIVRQRRHFSGTGALLDYDGSYAENMLLPPASKVQVMHHLGRNLHKSDKGDEKRVKQYKRIPVFY
jgi:hypothetical protein